MKVDEIGWGMWHAWEINAYIVWWEHLKESDYLGNLCVDRQIILKLIWKTWSDGSVGRGLSGLDTSGIRGSGMNTWHSQYQFYMQMNSQIYAPAALLHGKWRLIFIGWATAVLVMNMADPLSAD
jgi:hypothetical protein